MGFERGVIHIDKYLTNVARKYGARKFTWQRLFPPATVADEAGRIKVTNKEGYFKGAPVHVTGTPVEEGDGSYTYLQYACIEYGSRETVFDADVDRATEPVFNLRRDAVERATHRVQLGMEIRAMEVATLTSGGISAASPDHIVTPSNTWDDTTSSTPLEDIGQGKRMITDAIGREPNVFYISTEVEQMLARHPTIKDIMKYHTDAPVTKGGAPAQIHNMDVVVSNVVYNSANTGQTATFANIWRRHAFIAFVEPGSPVNFAKMLIWARRNMRTRTWRNDELEGQVFEIISSYVPKIVTPDAAYWFQNVIAA